MKISDLLTPFADTLQLAATPSLPNPPLIEWTSAWGDLFFRIAGADPQIVWCVLGRGAPEKRPLSPQRLRTLRKYISAAYAGRTFFRVVPFADGDDWALVRPKRALVKSAVQRTGAIWRWPADFPAPKGQISWLSQPLEWFENWLEEESGVELAKSRKFAAASEDERQWLTLCRTPEARARWEKLLPALQKLSYDLFEESTQSEPLHWKITVLYYCRDLGFSCYWNAESPDNSALPDLLNLLDAHFPIEYQPDSYPEIGTRGDKSPHVSPEFITGPVSQHERLEAALLWRDFGRDIGERARVEAALNQLLELVGE